MKWFTRVFWDNTCSTDVIQHWESYWETQIAPNSDACEGLQYYGAGVAGASKDEICACSSDLDVTMLETMNCNVVSDDFDFVNAYDMFVTQCLSKYKFN